jgi:hypothetical protein
MHYSSWEFSEPELIGVDLTDPDYYPMAQLTNGQKSLLPLPISPYSISQGDKEGIKGLYPWTGS